MRLHSVLVLLIICPAVYCQNPLQPLTQVAVCKTFGDSIVEVDTDTMHGTGFVVDSDGWIITALHVVADPTTLTKYGSITVIVAGHLHPIPAEVVSPIDDLARKRDFVILKVEKTGLHVLDLGSEANVEDGSPIAIIGFPLSASFNVPVRSVPRFCLAGTVAAQTTFHLGGLNFLHTIYFQGVSIKGISGAPIISLASGKVIGIVSTRLTGIGRDLEQLSDDIAHGKVGGGISMSGFSASDLKRVIDVLDLQLANGLGSGTGATDVNNALKEAQRNYKKGK